MERNEKTKKHTRNVLFFILFYELCFPPACRAAPRPKCGISLPPCSHIVNFRRSIHHPQQFSSRLCVRKSVSVSRENFAFVFVLVRHVHTDTHTCTWCARIHTWARGKKQIMMKKKQVFVTVTTGRSVAKTKQKQNRKKRVPPEPFSIFVAIYYADSKTLMMQIGSEFLTAI